MDPSLINNRTRRASIVKEAPLRLHALNNFDVRPVSQSKPLTSPKRVTKCHKNVTGALIPSEAPPEGGLAPAGGNYDQ